jgi:hypothetical protein
MSYTHNHPNASLVRRLTLRRTSLALKVCVISHRRAQTSASVPRFGAVLGGQAGPHPVRREEARVPCRERRTMVARDPGCYPV